MTEKQLQEFKAMCKANTDLQIETMRIVLDGLSEAKKALQETRKPFDVFNQKAASLGRFIRLIEKRSHIDFGHAASRGGFYQRLMHKEAVGIIR